MDEIMGNSWPYKGKKQKQKQISFQKPTVHQHQTHSNQTSGWCLTTPSSEKRKQKKKKKKNPTIHIRYINIIILFNQYYSLSQTNVSQSNRKTFKHKIFKENIFKKYGNIQKINLHNADNRAQNNIHLHIENDSRLSKLATMANTAWIFDDNAKMMVMLL